MTKGERQDVTLVAGLGVLSVGILLLNSALSSTWTLEKAVPNAIGIIVGGFLCVLGVALVGAALDVLDELSSLLSDIWDSFLGAIGRS